MQFLISLLILIYSLSSSATNKQETFEFSYDKKTDIKEIIKDYTTLMNINSIYSGSISGSLTILAPQKLEKRTIKEIFYTSLNELGLSAIEIGQTLKIIKSKNTANPNTPWIYKTQADVITKIIYLKNTTTDKIKLILSRLSSSGSISALPYNSLYIVGTRAIVDNYSDIIKILDSSKGSSKKIVFHHLKYTSSSKALAKLKQLKLLTRRTKALDFPEINSLGLYGSSHKILSLKRTLQELDSAPKDLKKRSVFIIPLDFTFADKTIKSLNSLYKDKDTSIKMVSNEYNNSILIWTNYENYYKIKKIINNKLDIKRPQVLFEVKVIEIAGDFSFNFSSGQAGISYEGEKVNVISGWEGKEVAAFQNTTESQIQQAVASTNAATIGVFLPNKLNISGLGKLTPAAFIKSLETSTYAKVISAPFTMGTDSETTTLSIGESINYLTTETNSAGITTTSVEKEDTSISLEIVPKVTPTHYIQLKLTVDISSIVGFGKNGLPRFSKKKIKEEIIIKNKQTAFIAGTFGYKKYTNKKRIPIIEYIPFLGALTTSTQNTYTKYQTLIMITPHIVYGGEDLAYIYKNKSQPFKNSN